MKPTTTLEDHWELPHEGANKSGIVPCAGPVPSRANTRAAPGRYAVHDGVTAEVVGPAATGAAAAEIEGERTTREFDIAPTRRMTAVSSPPPATRAAAAPRGELPDLPSWSDARAFASQRPPAMAGASGPAPAASTADDDGDDRITHEIPVPPRLQSRQMPAVRGPLRAASTSSMGVIAPPHDAPGAQDDGPEVAFGETTDEAVFAPSLPPAAPAANLEHDALFADLERSPSWVSAVPREAPPAVVAPYAFLLPPAARPGFFATLALAAPGLVALLAVVLLTASH